MRNIKNLQVPQNDDPNLPFGGIVNEGKRKDGTPVVEEIYGDVLSNLYKLVDEAGIDFNQEQDNDANGYQLLDGIKRLANEINDVEHIVSITGNKITVPINLDPLPDKFILFGQVSDNNNGSKINNYTFSGTGDNIYELGFSSGFNSGDHVMVVVDQAGVIIITLSGSQAQTGAGSSGVFPVFGTPLSYSEASRIYYEENGKLLTDQPSVENIQSKIRVTDGDGTLLVYTVVQLKDHFLCWCYIPSVLTYKLYSFALNDLDTPKEVLFIGHTVVSGTNSDPYLFTNGSSVYITNDGGNNADNTLLKVFDFQEDVNEMRFVSNITLPASYVKTTNTIVKDGFLTTFNNGALRKINLGTNQITSLGDYNGVNGLIFQYQSKVYFSAGEVAKEWQV